MDKKDAILKLIAEILELLNHDGAAGPHEPPTRRSWGPKGAHNGSARELLALVLGILLGALLSAVLNGCTVQNACIIGTDPADPAALLNALGELDFDTDTDTDTDNPPQTGEKADS